MAGGRQVPGWGRRPALSPWLPARSGLCLSPRPRGWAVRPRLAALGLLAHTWVSRWHSGRGSRAQLLGGGARRRPAAPGVALTSRVPGGGALGRAVPPSQAPAVLVPGQLRRGCPPLPAPFLLSIGGRLVHPRWPLGTPWLVAAAQPLGSVCGFRPRVPLPGSRGEGPPVPGRRWAQGAGGGRVRGPLCEAQGQTWGPSPVRLQTP